MSKSYCNMPTMKGTTAAEGTRILNDYTAILVHDLGPDGPRSQGEPALACYVTGACPGRKHRRA